MTDVERRIDHLDLMGLLRRSQEYARETSTLLEATGLDSRQSRRPHVLDCDTGWLFGKGGFDSTQARTR